MRSYLDEIDQQPEAIRKLADWITPELETAIETLRSAIEDGGITHVLITGMGGSLYSAYGTWVRLSQALSIPVSLWDASELIQQAPGLLRGRTLVIAVSQSGESAELRRMTEIDAATAGKISITNTPENSLTRWADISLATEVGPEATVSTKTYTAGLVGLHIVERLLIGRAEGLKAEIEALADAAGRLLSQLPSSVVGLLDFVGHDAPLLFIGRGASYTSAQMAALVTAEAAKAHTQALSGGQFRHGPLELVRAGFSSVLFMGGGQTRSLNAKTARDIAGFGGRCLVIEPETVGTEETAEIKVLTLPIVSEALLPVLEILPIQLLMVPMATARGFEPAKFLNGSKVTTVE